jgi:hypothetical protein
LYTLQVELQAPCQKRQALFFLATHGVTLAYSEPNLAVAFFGTMW